RFPALVGDAVRFKEAADGFGVAQRSLFLWNLHQCHDVLPTPIVSRWLRTGTRESRRGGAPAPNRLPTCTGRADEAETRAPWDALRASFRHAPQDAPCSDRSRGWESTPRARACAPLRAL